MSVGESVKFCLALITEGGNKKCSMRILFSPPFQIVLTKRKTGRMEDTKGKQNRSERMVHTQQKSKECWSHSIHMEPAELESLRNPSHHSRELPFSSQILYFIHPYLHCPLPASHVHLLILASFNWKQRTVTSAWSFPIPPRPQQVSERKGRECFSFTSTQPNSASIYSRALVPMFIFRAGIKQFVESPTAD